MKVSSTKAVVLFIFRRRRFHEVAVEWSKAEPKETEWHFPETPTTRLRRALFNSLLVVLVAIVAGRLTGVILSRSFGPGSRTQLQVLQYLGVGLLAWATLAKGGWSIQTWKGASLPEKVDQWIYRSLYFVGSFILVMSVSWSAL